jgi:hypothetical protein
MKKISFLQLTTFAIFITLNSCKKTPTTTTAKSQIINSTISTSYKPICEIGYGYDTVISYLNFLPDANGNEVNSVKVYMKNSTNYPDSFIICKGFTWIDFKTVTFPPKALTRITVNTEPNGTITLKLKDHVRNSKQTALYMDTISTRFELGKYNDLVNLTGYTKIESSSFLKIHLPSVNNPGKSSLNLVYDTLPIDSGSRFVKILFSRSVKDSAVSKLSIVQVFSVTSRTWEINIDDNGDCKASFPWGQNGGLFEITDLKRNVNDYYMRFRRTLDGALFTSNSTLTVTGYGCSNKVIFSKSYNF